MSSKFFRGARFQRGFGLGACCKIQQKGFGFRSYGSSQRGRGLGSMWSNFIRWISPIFSKVKNFAMPILKSGSKEVGKEVVSAASDIANAVIEGKDLKETASQRIETGVDNLIDKASKKLEGRGLSPPPINIRKRKIFGSFSQSKTKKKPRTLDIFDQL